ncbi:MAG: FtsX-like permease family protein, partial [bacterium]|nr:FtsX-like permease family protein [bacterium]
QKDPGYKKDQVLILPLMKKDVSLWGRIDVIKQRFLQHPSVLKVATSLFPPGMQNDTDKWPILAAGMTDPVDVHFLPVDDDFLDVYEIPLVAGRNLGDSDRFDFWNEENLPALRVLLNETAARELGGVKPGTHVRFERGDGQLDIEVVGIFKDFHNQTLHHPIKPLMLQFTTHRNFVSLRIQMQNLPETLAFVDEVWKSFLPNNPVDRWFMDEMLHLLGQNEIKMRSLYAFCAALAVFVACLGLMGLVAYTAEVRTKEIGIRKVMGASEPQLVGLLVKEFLLLIGIASILAWPVAWKVMAGWLQGFAYRVDLSVWFFLSGTVLAVVIALLTVSYQALKAARVNPVVALRYE